MYGVEVGVLWDCWGEWGLEDKNGDRDKRRVRTLIISKCQMLLVKKCHCKKLIIQISKYNF